MNFNKISKLDFVEKLINEEKYSEFYYDNENVLLSMDFDFEEMKLKFAKYNVSNIECDFCIGNSIQVVEEHLYYKCKCGAIKYID